MGSKEGPILSVLGGLIMLAYLISIPVFYGVFAFGSYEDWDCFASNDHSIKEPWIDDGHEVPDDYLNVATKFYNMNLWGFINFMVPIGIGCLTLCLFDSCRKCCKKMLAWSLILAAVSYISQLITMYVTRYSHAGRVCSGDFNAEMHFWTPLKGDAQPPYLHLNGSWLFYCAASQFYAGLMAVSGISFVAGNKR